MFAWKKQICNFIFNRQCHNNASLLENLSNVVNRNPRNLELMRLDNKPRGYTLEKPGRLFWHKLVIIRSTSHISTEIHHYENGVIIRASTKEWCIKTQLYRTCDSAAYINVGRVLARRCLENGIYFFEYFPEEKPSTKINLLIEQLESNGLVLKEPDPYRHYTAAERLRETKPWEIVQE